MSGAGAIKRLAALFKYRRAVPQPSWERIERFEPEWNERIRQMSTFISDGKTVVDFGCGPMWLKSLVPSSHYIPLDYVDRGPGTIVCDLNRDPYPEVAADIAFLSGVLEYIEEPHKLTDYIAGSFSECILSYCLVEDFPSTADRASLAWRNSFNEADIIELFDRIDFKLAGRTATQSRNSIFYFKRLDGTR